MRRLKLCFYVIAVCLLLSATQALAQHAAKGNAKGSNGVQEEITIGSAGQQVAVDPKTGKLRAPTPEEVQVLTESLRLNDSVEGLVPTVLPNGVVAVDLQGRFETVLMVKQDTDGTLSGACVATPKQATAFLKSDSSKVKPAQKPAAADPKTWEVK